jgi:branched-chain amino acid transport system substrate-binding protein
MCVAPAAAASSGPFAAPAAEARAPWRTSRRALLRQGATLVWPGWALAACQAGEPWRIGFLGGLSGRGADLGVSGRDGAQLAVDDLNAAGGVNGRRLVLTPADDEHNPEVALRALQSLADSGVAVVVGPMTSAMAVAIVPWANQKALPLVAPTVTTHELTGQRDAFFRVSADALTGAAQQARHLHRQGARTLVTVADAGNRAFSQSWAQGAGRAFEALGGRVLRELQFTSAPGLSHGDVASQVLAGRPDVALLAANATDSALLMQQLRLRDPRVELASSPWAGTEQLLQMGGRAVEGALVAQYHDLASQAPAYLQMRARYQQRFGMAPGYPAINAYDATLLAAEGLRRLGNGQGLIDTLRSVRSHNGLQRPLVIDEFGDCSAPLFLTRVREGRYAAVTEL